MLVDGGSVFSSVSTCSSDLAAVRLLRSTAGSSFAQRLDNNTGSGGDMNGNEGLRYFHWISPYILVASCPSDGSVVSFTWESPLVRGSPPSPGECPPPIRQTLSEGGGGGRVLGALWSSIRGKSSSVALAFTSIPPHDAQ